MFNLLSRLLIIITTIGPIVASVTKRPHIAVIGAGWGGWGAAKALCENGCRVTIIDSQSDPTGKTPYRTPSGKPFEAGTKGFWKDYPNIEHLTQALNLKEDETFTQFTNSSFYSPFGLEATAPVFSSSKFPQLPSPLGQVLASAKLFERIPISDRATMIGLLYAILDFDRDDATFESYDRMTAHELFIKCGVSKRLVEDFIRPTLLEGLFKPPEELSAAVVMELLYYYALAHQTSFDVRWIKSQSIPEKVFAPLAEKLINEYDITVLGGSRVDRIVLNTDDNNDSNKSQSSSSSSPSVSSIVYSQPISSNGQQASERVSLLLDVIDGCVLALGAKGMKGVMTGSPQLARLAPELARSAALGSIDVMACRLWLDRVVPTRSPVNVFSRFEGLRGGGGTFFLLDQLQGNIPELWGGEDSRGSVVACDFYNAGALLSLSDDDVVSLLMKELLPSAVPEFSGVKVVDSYVQRYPGAVSWFSPGSFKSRPPLVVSSLANVVCAGDWGRMDRDLEHGAKGLCQERAFVTGLEAANALVRGGILGECRRMHPVIPIREDEPQVLLGRAVNSQFKGLLGKLGIEGSPWVR